VIVYYFLLLYNLSFVVLNHNRGVMVSMLTPSVVDQGFEHPSEQKKNYQINICFSAKHASLRSKKLVGGDSG
jgi:hypothetical protein